MTESEFVAQMRLLIRSAVEKAKDGLTLAEVGQIFLSFVQIAMTAAAQFSIPGADKKKLVLAAILELYDALAPFLPLPWFLSPFRSIITAKLREIVLQLTSGIIEAVYSWWDRDTTPEPA